MNSVIGILGLGVRSTNFYTQQLHTKMHKHFGDYHTFPFLNYQIDFNRLNTHLPNNFEKLEPALTKILEEINPLKIQRWLIPNITLHETLDRVNHHLSLFHPVDLAIKNCIKNNIKSVVILGTNYSMESNYLASNFNKNDISIITISKDDKAFVDQLRIKNYNAEETRTDIENYNTLIKKYTQNSHAVIACTELSLLSERINNNKIIDLAQLQISEAFQFYLEVNRV